MNASITPTTMVYVAIVDSVEVAEGKTAQEAIQNAEQKGYTRTQIRLSMKAKTQ